MKDVAFHYDPGGLCALEADRQKRSSAWATPPACSPLTAETKTYHAGMMEKFDGFGGRRRLQLEDWERSCLRFWWPDSRPAP